MPQIFQVLRCYQCQVFQIHQTKKSSKFQCKLCGEKQSIKRHYGIGTAKDCRFHVQRLNGIRGEIDELKENISSSASDEENELHNIQVQSQRKMPGKSKWKDYVDENEGESSKSVPETETMYLNNTEVVLEVPKKRKKTNFKCPSLKRTSETMESSYCEENAANNIISKIKQEYIPGVKNFDKESNKSKEVSNKKCVKVEPKEVANAFLKPTVIPNAERKASITQISNVKKEIRKIITPVANSNSKWAQFVEEEQEEDDTKEIESFQVINGTLDRAKVFEDLDQSGVYKNSQELFALCGDNDLDDVLDF